jgi:hypothetical protein
VDGNCSQVGDVGASTCRITARRQRRRDARKRDTGQPVAPDARWQMTADLSMFTGGAKLEMAPITHDVLCNDARRVSQNHAFVSTDYSLELPFTLRTGCDVRHLGGRRSGPRAAKRTETLAMNYAGPAKSPSNSMPGNILKVWI